jgi:hypothetical protein
VPFAGPGPKPLVFRKFRCQCGRHVKARGRLSSRPLAGLGQRQIVRSPLRFGTCDKLRRQWQTFLSAPKRNLACHAFRRLDAEQRSACSAMAFRDGGAISQAVRRFLLYLSHSFRSFRCRFQSSATPLERANPKSRSRSGELRTTIYFLWHRTLDRPLEQSLPRQSQLPVFVRGSRGDARTILPLFRSSTSQ